MAATAVAAYEKETYSRVVLGFWIYLMTDCLIFGTLFATYEVLKNSTFGGPTSKEIIHLPLILGETFLLLTSSLTAGLAMLAACRNEKNKIFFWFFLTFILGASFVTLEWLDFSNLVQQGHSWQRSAFLSAYFTLVGTHGLHVTIGLLWLTIMIAQLYFKGLIVPVFRRLVCFNLFWHFLDFVWIFIFTFVYLLGVI